MIIGSPATQPPPWTQGKSRSYLLCMLPWMAQAGTRAARGCTAARRSVARAALAGAALLLVPATSATLAAVPTWAELEAAGARIGQIHLVPLNIFDTDRPEEDRALFRLANRLHRVTRPEVIRSALPIQTGDALSVKRLEETERLLRANRFLYEVQIRPVAVREGVVDLEVITRDTWSLEPGLNWARAGGADSSALQLREYNLAGTGIALALDRFRNVDRSGTLVRMAWPRALGSAVSIDVEHARNSDGHNASVSVQRPFSALDTRWAAGFSAASDERLEATYVAAGEVDGRYRHRQRRAQVFLGHSTGLQQGWVQRAVAGVWAQEERYAVEPGLPAPPRLPQDQTLVVPYLRYELLEDRFERALNRNLMGRAEFFTLGLQLSAQLGVAAAWSGSSRSATPYAFSVSRGFVPVEPHMLLASAHAQGEFSDGSFRRQSFGLDAQYYQPQSPRRLLYAQLAMDALRREDAGTQLLLGGDNGLRGYPLRQQAGRRRVLMTLEQRFYTDLYVWQLFRIGGAAFLDAGRAWGDGPARAGPGGWLYDAGAGLRIFSVRSAFSHVLHLDVATPLGAPAGLRRPQFLVRTKTGF